MTLNFKNFRLFWSKWKFEIFKIESTDFLRKTLILDHCALWEQEKKGESWWLVQLDTLHSTRTYLLPIIECLSSVFCLLQLMLWFTRMLWISCTEGVAFIPQGFRIFSSCENYLLHWIFYLRGKNWHLTA